MLKSKNSSQGNLQTNHTAICFLCPLLHVYTALNRLGLELSMHCNEVVQNTVVLANKKHEKQKYISDQD